MKKPVSKTIITLAVLLLSSAQAFSQHQSDHWYFGSKAGIDFSSGAPVADLSGQMDVVDNCVSMSDHSGQLLFYTNGVTVWNSSHAVMMNGTGLNGNIASSHPATAFKIGNEGSSSPWYIVTAAQFAGSDGLQYSTIDMALDGGKGAVVLKNMPLATDMTEKVLAIRHANGNDVWILAHGVGDNKYYAWLATASGIGSTPVISAVGSVHPLGAVYGYGASGQMAINSDGSRIAVAIYDPGFFEILSFDKSTGIVSSPINIPAYTGAYGIEFSPDGSKLYGAAWKYADVYQFDLSVYTAPAIIASATVVGTVTGPHPTYKAGNLMLAPDGRIYIAKWESDYIAYIGSPNAPAASCGFVDDGFYLGGRESQAGFPLFMKEDIISSISKPSVSGTPVELFPNPADDGFSISLPGLESSKDISVSIYNLGGQKVLELSGENARGRIDCSLWTPGVYVAEVIAGGAVIGHELIEIH